MTRPAPIIAGTLAAFVLLFVFYMGAYYALVLPYTKPTLIGYMPNFPSEFVYPEYKVKGVDAFFDRAYLIDRSILRPAYWRNPWHEYWEDMQERILEGEHDSDDDLDAVPPGVMESQSGGG